MNETMVHVDHIIKINNLFNNIHKIGRQLNKIEKKLLINQGNYAENWDKIYISDSFELDKIKNCSFYNNILLYGGLSNSENSYTNENRKNRQIEYYNTSFNNCIISFHSIIKNNSFILNTFMDQNLIIEQCGTILFSDKGKKSITFGEGRSISIGNEIGGRDILCYAEMKFNLVHQLAIERDNETLQNQHKSFIHSYINKISSFCNYIGDNSTLSHCPSIKNVYIGQNARIIGSTLSNVTLLSSKNEASEIKESSFVKNSILQWNTIVSSMGIVENSFMFEHTYVNKHGKLLNSILGPNSSISEGECSSSLVGPFVGFHHQALLIASVWPQGKGNIGYGANVGSNHTLKAPDQELWPGEGLFFGLGVSIKFPSNFVNSPYSVIATGVSTLPQKLEMPFSLINIPSSSINGISPAINEIFPGWVLSQSIFTILRNEEKFLTRNKSKRSHIVSTIFRSDIILLLIDARTRLLDGANRSKILFGTEPIYTDKEVKGLGKNYMTEKSRLSAIQSYTFYIQFYYLTNLLNALEKGFTLDKLKYNDLSIEEESWKENWNLLNREFSSQSLVFYLEKLITFSFEIAKTAENGKKRDDKRGKEIISDYNLVHKSVKDEKVIIEAYRRARDIELRTQKFIKISKL